MARGGGIGADEQVWMQTTVTASAGDKVFFYWKVSSEQGSDYLQFYIDSTLKDQISGEVGCIRPHTPVLDGVQDCGILS